MVQSSDQSTCAGMTRAFSSVLSSRNRGTLALVKQKGLWVVTCCNIHLLELLDAFRHFAHPFDSFELLVRTRSGFGKRPPRPLTARLVLRTRRVENMLPRLVHFAWRTSHLWLVFQFIIPSHASLASGVESHSLN